jgi:hypothetical protein
VPIKIGGTKVILIDTPGFDDPRQTDSQILEKISRLLSAMYHLKVNLKGVIYLHRITDVRFPRSAVKTLDIFKEICGETALKNVVLATTRWKRVKERDGVQREQNLCEHFWKDMLDKGSQMVRYHGDRDSAKGIIAGLIGKSTVVLDLQHELVEQEKPLSQTKAGKLVSEDVATLKEEYEKNLVELESRRRASQDSERTKKRAQIDWEAEMAKLKKVELDEARLNKNIAEDVRIEIDNEVSKTKKSRQSLAQIISAIINVLSLFLGLDTSAKNDISEWVSEDSSS